MRRERDRERGALAGELLLDLRRVAVAADLVRRHVLVGGDEVRGLRRLAPGAGHARLGVDHDVAEQPGAGERGEREQRGGRVAAGVGDEVGAGDLLAVQLGQPVDAVAEQARAPRAGRTSPRRCRGRAAGSRPRGRRPARRARAAPRPPARRRRAASRRAPRRRRPGRPGPTARARAARACAGGRRRAARPPPSARSRARARRTDGGGRASRRSRPRTRWRRARRRAR